MSSDATPRLNIAVLPPTPAQPQVTHNEALITIDALTDICLLGQFVNTPPVSPSDGDTWLLGGAPTGAWSGQSYKLAYCLDGGWRFLAPFNGLRAYVAASHAFLVYASGTWSDANALIGAAEVSVASAATCDLGAAGSLFVAITGSAAITSLGTGANLMRFLRFAGAATLTHNATSLVLPGAANITAAAGDTAIASSDGSGNWRVRAFSRAGAAQRTADILGAGPGGTVLDASGLHIGGAGGKALDVNGDAAMTGAVTAMQAIKGARSFTVAAGAATDLTNINDLGHALVTGSDSSSQFIDRVVWGYYRTPIVKDQDTLLGTPPTRTYSLNGTSGNLKLTLGAGGGPYAINVTQLGGR